MGEAKNTWMHGLFTKALWNEIEAASFDFDYGAGWSICSFLLPCPDYRLMSVPDRIDIHKGANGEGFFFAITI